MSSSRPRKEKKLCCCPFWQGKAKKIVPEIKEHKGLETSILNPVRQVEEETAIQAKCECKLKC